MKRNFVLAAFIAVTALALSASARKVTDFSGKWNLDVSKSKLDERSRIESQVLTVTQTDKEIRVETATKRLPATEGTGPRRGEGRGNFGGGDVPAVYSLVSKETIVEENSPTGTKVPAKFAAKVDGPKLLLSQSRTFTNGMGEITVETKGTWELSENGKILTINREQTTPRGTVSTTMVYTKQ
jgi:hypothetical protein